MKYSLYQRNQELFRHGAYGIEMLTEIIDNAMILNKRTTVAEMSLQGFIL